MKRMLILLTALCLTGCGMQRTGEAAQKPEPDAAQNVQTFTDSDGTKIRLDRNRYSEHMRLLNADAIWISSYRCGYLSGMPRNSRWIIRSQEELDTFNRMYGLHCELPDEYPNHGDDVEMPYDFEHDAMLIEYAEVSSTGYDLKAAGVLIDGETLQFVMSTDSKSPGENEEVGAMMDGFLWEAALYKSVLPLAEYPGWTYITAEPETSEAPTESGSEDIGELSMKPAEESDIVTDPETGIRYVKNQLLVSCTPGTGRAEVEQLVESVGADIVGCIELTGDYQIEFREDKSAGQLQEIADQMEGCPFVETITVNFAEDSIPAAE